MTEPAAVARRLISEMDAYFGRGKQDEGPAVEKSREGATPPQSRAPMAPTAPKASAEPEGLSSALSKPGFSTSGLTLHDYKRNPEKRRMAEWLLGRQKGRCNLGSEGGVCGGRFFEIDHRDGDPANQDPRNLQLLCESHHRAKTNSDRRRPTPVSVHIERAFRPRWSSNEGARHDYQRPKFNAWLYDPEIGLARAEGARFHPKGLAKAAVHGVGPIQGKLGSSVTYERYVEEDFNGGFWEPIQGSDDIQRTATKFPLEPGPDVLTTVEAKA